MRQMFQFFLFNEFPNELFIYRHLVSTADDIFSAKIKDRLNPFETAQILY